MAALSEYDHDIITRHPLGSSLDHLRKSLRDAEQSCASISSSHDDATNNSTDDRQKAISRLLTALLGAEAALILRSKISSRDVASELALLFGRVRKGDLNMIATARW